MNRSTPGFPCPTPIPGVYPNMSIELVMPFNRLILCHPLLLLTSVFPSIKVFSNELPLHIRWLKDWSFSLSISASNEHPGLISFRMDWLDLLAIQGTLKSLLQNHNQKHQFFSAQLSLDFPGGSDGKASVYDMGDQVQFLGWEDPLEKEMAIHSSTLAWKIPWTEEPDRLQSMGSRRVRHN